MAKTGGSNNAQFTYDFGIAIAQSTVNKITRLTGATLSLASAFYALKTTAADYVKTLKDNALYFGGMLSTMKAMEQAQNRLIKGQSYFSVDDQLKGMQQLMKVGVDVGENLEWINKAAHATGRSYAEFAGIISSAIQGNSQALVDAGLMTQRASRMFDKYAANTVMRQQAILNFVKSHKGLMSAIKNDFDTIQDQMLRIKGTWKSFVESVVGKPNDPQSLYGQLTGALKMVTSSFAHNAKSLKRYGYMIGQTLGWVVKQVGHLVVWMGRQVKKVLTSVWKVTDDFQNQSRSLLVWLEFWKQKILDFFRTYSDEIKTVLKLLIAYKALKTVFVIGGVALKSVLTYGAAIRNAIILQKRYIAAMGPYIGKTAKFFQSLAVWLPAPFRKAWVWLGKFFAGLSFNLRLVMSNIIHGVPKLFGWFSLAITLLTTLYVKSEKFRTFVNNLFKATFEFFKLIWNIFAYDVTAVMIGCKKIWSYFKVYVWEPIASFFQSAWGWIEGMWARFMNTSVGKWIDRWIVTPLKTVFQWIVDAWNWVVGGISKAISWLSKSNDKVAQATKDLAEANGVPVMPTFGGGTYDTNDSTNYLNPGNWKAPEPNEPTGGNPLLTGNGLPGVTGTPSPENTTNMSFSNGAIQIIVQKGEDIDERTLARKVKEVIDDMRRSDNIRGGNI